MGQLSLATIIFNIIILLIAFPVHEFAHAWVANSFGDDTPRLNGRLTLNPLKHLDVMGSLMLVVAGFGWAKPVPVSPYALQRHSRSALMWVSLAGPLSNLSMAIYCCHPVPAWSGLTAHAARSAQQSHSWISSCFILFTSICSWQFSI